jgi:universal stress protein E
MKAVSERRETGPEAGLFGHALVCGRSEQETRPLIEQAYPLVQPGGVSVQLWQPGGEAEKPPDAVLSAILAAGHDLVMKALTPDEDGPGAALDPLDTRLIRQCPCPVWLSDPAQARPLRRVLAAIDPVVEERVAQAARILSLAGAVATAAGAELHVLHAWVAYGESLLRPRTSPEELGEYVEAEREDAVARVEKALAGTHHRVPRERVHLLKGDFQHVLPAVVSAERMDLAVMGSRGRRGWLASALLRPYAELVLRHMRGPVLVVKGSEYDRAPAAA